MRTQNNNRKIMDNGLSFVSDDDDDGGYDKCCNGEASESLKFAALEAANKSHAPYSKCPSGVAIMDSEGKVYKGSYMESAAYNPSLGPVQAALVAYVASGNGGGYERIVDAVLVEKEGAVVRQEHTARLLLQVQFPVVFRNLVWYMLLAAPRIGINAAAEFQSVQLFFKTLSSSTQSQLLAFDFNLPKCIGKT
ncbi:hypothetical protein Pint_13374 [Pistacia integerrima]|uniref:Uncharacterized protein n=1 Tax=Pistacia integerrima TaxID=434235 RepID=A0ACC0Y3P1_9ROSI|nr:hypothetical protein Pint_13374 [Pistacia integerrima]